MDQANEPISQLELAVLAAQALPNGSSASDQLRGGLRDAISALINDRSFENHSLEDCLNAARERGAKRVAAILMLRTLVLPSVVPHASEWTAIALFEAALPDFFKHLQYDPKSQNFEKWRILVSVHAHFQSEIFRLLDVEGSLQEIESRKQNILKGLSNKLVGEYCKPFGFERIRAEAQTILALLSECLEAGDERLGPSINDLRQHLSDFENRHTPPQNFLSARYLSSFLDR